MNLLKAEYYKLFRSAAFWLLLGVMILCAAAFGGISCGLARGTIGMAALGGASGLMDTMIVTLLLPIAASSFIASDFSNKSIHSMLLYGGDRSNVVCCKLIVFIGAVFLLLLPYGLMTFIGFVSRQEFSIPLAHAVDSAYMSILANETEIGVTAGSIGKLIAALFAVTLLHAARVSICVWLAFWLKKPIGVIGAGILAELFLTLMPVLLAGSEMASKILGWTPFMFMNTISLSMGIAAWMKVTGVSLVFIAAVYAVAVLSFRRAEIK